MKLLKYVLLFILSGWLVIKGIVPAWHMIHSDFSNYYVSASLVMEQQDLSRLYQNDWFKSKVKEHGIDEPGKFGPFPPITAWVMLPLTFTDALSAKRIFTLLNCLLLMFCIWLIHKLTEWDWASSALLILAAGNGLVNNFRFGQLYLLIASGIMVVLYMERKSNIKAASFVLGFIACLKYLPIVLLASFIFLKKYKMLGYSIGSITLWALMQFLFFGNQVMEQFIGSVLLPHLNGEIDGQEMNSYLFQSWDSLLRNIFNIPSGNNPSSLSHLPLVLMVLKGLIYLLIGSSLLISLIKLNQSLLSQQSKYKLMIALPFFAAFSILPVSASYHFVLLVVPICLLLSVEELIQSERIIITSIYSSIGILPYAVFFKIASFAGVVFAYPRLALVTLLYLFTLYLINFKMTGRHQKKVMS